MNAKRILSIFTCAAMLATLMTTAVWASSVPTVSVSSAEVSKGEAVDLTVSIGGNTGIANMKLSVGYDSNALKLNAVTDAGILGSHQHSSDYSSNPYTLYWLNENLENNITANGKIVTLKFEALSTAASGEYPISVAYNDNDITDKDSNAVNFAVENGKITVKGKTIPSVGFYEKTFTYDGIEKSVVISGNPPLGATVSYENNKAVNAGTYNAKATIKAEGYDDLVLETQLIIKKKKITLSGVSAQEKAYDGTTEAIITGGTLTGVVAGDIVTPVVPKSGVFATANAGNNISVSVDGFALAGEKANNYEIVPPSGIKSNIVPAPISVKADDTVVLLGDAVPELTYTITGGELLGKDALSGEPATAANILKEGEYDITQGSLKVPSDNYVLKFEKGILRVVDMTRQNIIVSDISEVTYGDEAFVVSVTPDSESGLNNISYSSSNPDVAEIAADGTVTIKGAGETNIIVSEPGNEEYAPFKKVQKLTVKKKDLTITSVDANERTAVFEGVVAGDESSVLIDFTNAEMNILEDIDAQNKRIELTGLGIKGDKADNYEVADASIESEIKVENLVTVTATKDYGEVEGAGYYIKGSKATLKAIPASGYRFNGWYINEKYVSAEEIYKFTVNDNITLKAKFKKRSAAPAALSGYYSMSYTVKFDTNGGNSVKDITVLKGSKVGSITKPKKEGYIFTGWFADKEMTKEYDLDTKISAGTTLYAGWKIDPIRQMVLTIGEKAVTLWNEAAENDVAPIIRNDRTMLPARFVAENLGAKVEWNEEEKKVTVTRDDITIVIIIDSDKAYINGEEKDLDSPAFIENDRTYTPLRFIAEGLGAEVGWDGDTKQVIITK